MKTKLTKEKEHFFFKFQYDDWSSAREVTLNDIGKGYQGQTTTKHNKVRVNVIDVSVKIISTIYSYRSILFRDRKP